MLHSLVTRRDDVGVGVTYQDPSLRLLLLLLLVKSTTGEEGDYGFNIPRDKSSLRLCEQGGGGGGGGEGKCVLTADKVMRWQEAHHFCRSEGGFLASRDEYSGLSDLPSMSNSTTLTWTALTPLHGHYQWLSECPAEYSTASTDFMAWRGGRGPMKWDRSCAALDVDSMLFELVPCTTELPVFCFLHPDSPAGVIGEGEAGDVYLVVEGDLAPGPEGNLSLSREDFGNVTLTCTAYNRTSGTPLNPQPTVFWRKDLVYSGHCIGSLIPAILHDRTKSPAEWDTLRRDTSPRLATTQQGTYWCEAWGPSSASTQLVSNKVLLTLQDVLVFIVEAHMKENPSANLAENNATQALRNAFLYDIPTIQTLPLDMVMATKKYLPGPPPFILASYTFHIHLPKEDLNRMWLTLEEALQHKAEVLTRTLSIYSYENTSKVTFPSLCLNHTSPSWGEGAPDLKWPVTYIGPVHPSNYRCEMPHGRLAVVGHCLWNYTHGAHLTLKPQPCRWRGVCPQGYTAVTNRYCMAMHPSGSWQEGFKAVHTTGQELNLLSDDLQRMWQEVKPSVEAAGGTDNVWLPYRRLRTGASLQYLGPLPHSEYDLTKQKVTWAQDHPLPDFDCLAMNLTAGTLHTHPCNAHLPFPVLINVPPLNRYIRFEPQLWKQASLYSRWYTPTLRGDTKVYFRLFSNIGNFTWDEARQFCKNISADLPAPNIGFLDMVFRQFLRYKNVESVWMSPYWVSDRVVYSGPQDTLGWTADTNYSLHDGELTPRGWLLQDGGTRQDILCQTLEKPTDTRLSLKVLPPATPAESLCVQADPLAMLHGGNTEEPDLRCFVNGRTTNITVQGSKSPRCVVNIQRTEPGYYQCVGWTVAPVTLVFSNTILHSPTAFTILVTLLEPETRYDPLLHDATFTPAHSFLSQSCSCCEALNGALKNVQVVGVEELSARHQNFLASPDGRLLHALQVECRGITSTVSEFEVLESLTSQISLGQQMGTCTVQAIRSTQGCEREVTMYRKKQESETLSGNLTWPSTLGSRHVVSEEPCVTITGEPVTRECMGDFLVGYHWAPAGHCTGIASNLTRELWLANREPYDSLEKTEAALQANISALQPVDIFLVAKTLEAAAEAPPQHLRRDQLVSVMDRILTADNDAFLPVQQRLGSSDTLLEAFEKLFFQMNSTNRNQRPQSVSGNCLAVESVVLAPKSPVIGYKSMEKAVRGQREKTLMGKYTEADLKGAAAAIILPKNISLEVAARTELEEEKADNVELPFMFAVYRNDKLFQESETVETTSEGVRRYRVNSEVIQGSFGTEVRGLQEDVVIYFKPRLPGNDTKCVFWDLEAHGQRGGWSEEGCRSGGREGDLHVCLCNHLTCFAQLINYDESAVFSDTHATVLNIITVVGCCLSILGLLLVFFTFLLFQRWRRPLSNKILVNLCLAEFCSLTVFLAGVDQTLSGPLCRSVAVALHYFILASFGWMVVEAVHQYLNFVKVVGTYIPRFMWKASVCAWGIPLLPVLVLLVYDSSLYDHDGSREDGAKICWMSSTGFWIGMLPPLAATMTVNLVMYGLILYGVTCGRPSVPSTLPERALLMNQLRMAVCVFFLLGLTWVFGLLAVSRARLVFSYLFCIFTTLKGFLLFVFHVCRERGARRYWEDFLSVLKHESSVSSPGDSAHAAHYTGRPPHHDTSLNPCGGIKVLPPVVVRRPRPSTRTSLLPPCSSSTPRGSQASFSP